MTHLILHFKDQHIPITQDKFIIGRCDEPDLEINTDTTSRHHAFVCREGERHFIQDNCSTHGTLHQQTPITKKQIEDGDVFFIGGEALRFSYQSEP